MQSVEKFRRFLEIQNVNPNTVKAYLHTAGKFIDLVGGKPIDEDIVLEFLDTIPDVNSRARHLYGLKSYLKYIKNDAADRLKASWETRKLEWWLTPKQVESLIANVPFPPERNRAIIRVGYDLARRIGEVILLNRKDLDEKHMTLQCTILKKRGRKLIKKKTIYKSTLKALKTYLATRMDRNPAMFIGPNGRLGDGAIELMLKVAQRKANIKAPKQISYHDLRHARSAHLREKGIPIDTLKDFLEHDRLTTTLIYSHISKETLKSEVLPPDI